MSPSAIDFEATNGYSSHQNGPSSPTNSDAPYDLVCVGFGPAALAIAVALHDSGLKRNVLFLEKQSHFAWHSGMLIPSAKMQISFVKDLATFRSPQSHFTFLNYLHTKNRLAQFCNLNTFLPHREEFNDYLTWAAGHFDECVRYSSDTQSISPVSNSRGDVQYWEVTARDTRSEELSHFTAKDVVIAVGGSPKLPRSLDSFGERIVHSSQYLKAVPRILSNQERKTRVAVVGGGQSAAEIFEDLMNKYPNVHATLYTSGAALKPSDDSPL
jgi:L-ornithine N5-oxygenase